MGKKNKGKTPTTTTDVLELTQKPDSQNNKVATPTPDLPTPIDHFYKALPKVGGVIYADQYVAARMQEINSMQSSIKQTSAALKLPSFEYQPRFLRRRAASHLLHHLRARDRARLSVKLANGRHIRHSYRKIKSKILMDELISRKSTIKWLPTHKWSVKRMKMENWWGYRLGARLMYKSRNITYRSFTKIALLHDASYQGCLQLCGSQSIIVELLNKFTDPLLPSVGSLRFTKGTRVGHSYFYDQYPAHLVSPVTFLWRASSADNDAMIWLWIHPSSFDSIQSKLTEEVSLMKTLDKQVEIQDLRQDLARFELTGPRSLALLQSILDPVEESDNTIPSTISCQMWRGLQQFRSGCCIPNGTAIGLTVQDPRLRFPQKARPTTNPDDWNSTTHSSQEMLAKFMNWPMEASISDIWDKSIRDHCQATKTAESRLLKRREQMPMPGSKLPFDTTDDSRIPILLIQRNGPLTDQLPPARLSDARTEHIDGWTLIVPWTFGNSFWRSLVYAGARIGGLDDVHNMYFDCGYSCFPYDYPTTTAFEEYQDIIGIAAKERWERRPPSKRLNFTKLGIDSPHRIPFKHVLTRPSSCNDNIGVLLQNEKLVSIILDSTDKGRIEKTVYDTMVKAISTRGMPIPEQPSLLESMVVKIRLDSEHGGILKSGARIYLMEDADFAQQYTTCRNKRQVKEMEKPKPPKPEDLVGFVTTGGYSLITGQGQGVGACSVIGLHRIQDIDTKQKRSLKRLVLVHNMTCREYTLATLSLI